MSHNFRSQFPFFAQSSTDLVYLDSAATSHKLDSVLNAIHNYHVNFNANVHRGSYVSAQKASNEYEKTRAITAEFIGAKNADEIIFTSGATEAVNIIASGLNKGMLSGDEILICASEHHANILPWQQHAKRLGLTIKVMPLETNGLFNEHTFSHWMSLINENTAIVAFAHVSNVLGNIYPVEKLCEKARSMNALSVIDGTQAASHINIDVQDIDCDFYAFSGHKMYAATGIGVLYGKYEHLLALSPSKWGGEMISKVSWTDTTLQPPPLKFEAGTSNIAGVLSLAPAITFIKQNRAAINAHEANMYQRLLLQLLKIKNVNILGNKENSVAVVAFTVDGVHANDIAIALASKGIACRAGHHCAMPLMQALGIEGCVRVSLACYNQNADIDALNVALLDAISELSGGQASLGELSLGNENIPHNVIKQTDLKQDSADDFLELITKFKKVSSWNDKHRLLMLESKQLPLLEVSRRNESNEINGCEANVWIAVEILSNNTRKFVAYSNSKVVRGLLTLLLAKTNHDIAKNSDLPVANNLHMFLDDLGLPAYFSQGRRDGINKVIQRIESLLHG